MTKKKEMEKILSKQKDNKTNKSCGVILVGLDKWNIWNYVSRGLTYEQTLFEEMKFKCS